MEGSTVTKYDVQFELPVEDPVNNVRMKRSRGVIHFFVPLNHPDAHNLGLADLMAAVERRELLTISTDLNNTVKSQVENSEVRHASNGKAAPSEDL